MFQQASNLSTEIQGFIKYGGINGF